MPLTGPAVDCRAINEYIEKAFNRAAGLGVSVVVFGSPLARNVPDGFPWTEAWCQFAEVVGHAGTRAAEYGLNLAVEAIRRAECNFINRHAEALELVRHIDLPHVRNLVDFYHLSEEGESLEVIEQIGPRLEHVHLARRQGRTFPKLEQDNEFRAFFTVLKKIGYTYRVSIEAYSTAVVDDARDALAYLHSLT
jgi:sugar phosphate isomerase/epimerase